MLLVSMVLFAIFGSFLGGLDVFGPYWPVLLIALGMWIFIRAILRKN
jgi:hypothetical protein